MISLLKQHGAKSKINKRSETPEKIALIIENESVQKCLGCFVADNDEDIVELLGLDGIQGLDDPDVGA